jgi:hypothetical protein
MFVDFETNMEFKKTEKLKDQPQEAFHLVQSMTGMSSMRKIKRGVDILLTSYCIC